MTPRTLFSVAKVSTYPAPLVGFLLFADWWIAIFVTAVIILAGHMLMTVAIELDPTAAEPRSKHHDRQESS